ncbi:CHRD domain-containing protein [Snuella lapsa]|uniref:CHRD domain-containing protein n=1 Tax=Snuella lapsa TaxID=870481 RepID=A0ABP6WNK9_9FLAO
MITHSNTLRSYLLLLVFGLTLVGFSNKTNTELSATTDTFDHNQFIFNVHLSGANEVPANDSEAFGRAIVRINKSETMIYYKVIVNNIMDVKASHFHMAPAGSNSGVVATLFTAGTSGWTNGLLAEGTIQAENLQGALAGQELSALIDAIRAGNIYVNVHTATHPGGEIRGQL